MARRWKQIVDPNDILGTEDIRNEFWNLDSLIPELEKEVVLQWCVRRKLIKNEMRCSSCNELSSSNRYSESLEGYRCMLQHMPHKKIGAPRLIFFGKSPQPR
ncbi:hypothetical protein BgiMline_020959 [Biomphalaria glabrata]|nr:hypothetical protein BgiMline_018129 [Biomphalaria glabrata]